MPVILLGFAATDITRLDAIFRQQTQGERRYTIAGGTERSSIVLVNYDNPVALQQCNVLRSKQPDLQVIAVSKGPLSNPPSRHIRGLLLASRVLSVLDTQDEAFQKLSRRILTWLSERHTAVKVQA